MTNPTPTLTSITVNSTGAQVLLGLPETFTAIANFSNGTNQVVTGGVWGSEQPSVASVASATGRVTATDRRRGDNLHERLRGYAAASPSTSDLIYGGAWVGSYAVVATCSESGSWTTLGLLHLELHHWPRVAARASCCSS